ncbi:hypothetical protein [Nocardioides cynanchi]|uniref:hypothetical protein n=1 Tax=Nocardioides cynanchi TaxID=2558918 RepID=UPI001248C6AE|nr:hypothetical protein [Nocardioides cynanchi]
MVTPVLAVLAMVVGLVALATGPSVAGPVNAGWSASGNGTVTTVSNGSAAAASMTYNADGFGIGSTASWTFTSQATTDSAGTIKVPYTWQGLHAWFQVTTRLDMVVNGSVVGTLVSQGPVNCCTSPSNGFVYGGVATFNNVQAGDTYGFKLSGSNADQNNFLRGTFTLSTKPYIDATIGTDNRQWLGASDFPAGGTSGTLNEPGEARWYRFPVVPGQQVTVNLGNLPADYDLALYGDIGAAFQRLGGSSDITSLAAASAAGAPGSGSQVPDYPTSVTKIASSTDTLPSTTFAPRVYAPRVYAPRVYAPRVYAPRVYAPRVYAPRVYAPDSFLPDLASDPSFAQAFTAAQDQTLLAVSANTSTDSETVSASTGNTDGYFYVRVQGHTDQQSNKNVPFTLTRSTSGNADCAGLVDFSGQPLIPQLTADSSTTDPGTVVLTDTNKLGLAPGSSELATYQQSLHELATATNADVVDVADSPRVQSLWGQVADHPSCPYAINLVADAIASIGHAFRGPDTKYVVLAGGDDVIPFFRYPDVSGLGQESQFIVPVLTDSPSNASLAEDQVQSQDAYGSDQQVTIGGSTLPLPDLGVGRLVKTPEEIEATIDHDVNGLTDFTLPAPTSSLVTGYDFLADAAHSVGDQFAAALPGGTNDQLITNPNQTPAEIPWTADQLHTALTDSHHDLVYLAGHFSANDTLAADFTTTLDATTFAPGTPDEHALTDTLVLSAGCHSGYNIVDGAAVPGVTNTYDWTQAMADQHAVLIGGTGYQYGDSDFTEYSERLYLDIARRLHEGPASPATPPPGIAVGSALALAKQDYLSGLSTVTGIDQKAMLEATLYGLPMTKFDAPSRSPLPSQSSQVSPGAVGSAPGSTFGLGTFDHTYLTPTDSRTKDSGAGAGLPDKLTWLNGADGVTVMPGAPALPKQIEDVTVAGQVLRGVGFRSGSYHDDSGLLPLTGAPAIEGSTANTTFESSAFFPQRLTSPNYFGALGHSGRTSLILTPAQYRSDAVGSLTDTQRAYSSMGVRLFYSPSDNQGFNGNTPVTAAAPSIGGVHGTVTNGVVTFSVTSTGDPSAGVQQVWVTWTGGPDANGDGHWDSVDLTQDPNDSTHWSGALNLPPGQASGDVRFLVQAANGVGAVGLDTAEGDGYPVVQAGPDQGLLTLRAHTATAGSPLGVTAGVEDAQGSPVAGRTVTYTVSRGGIQLFAGSGTTSAGGSVEIVQPSGQQPPSGRLTVRANLLDSTGAVVGNDTLIVVLSGATLSLTPTSLVGVAGGLFPSGVTATLRDANGPMVGVPVTFDLTGTGAAFTTGPSVQVTTNSAGVAVSPVPRAGTAPGDFVMTVSADGATNRTVPMLIKYTFSNFISPVNTDKKGVATASTNATGTVPVKTSALLPNGTKLDDATAAALVAAGRLQIRWRLSSVTSGGWTARTNLTRYDAVQHFFQSDLKPSTLGWQVNKSYTVQIRILPAVVPTLPPTDPNVDSFDLGSKTLTISVTK